MGGFIGTVHRQMRLGTLLTVALQTANALLLAGVAGVAIFAWQQAAISLGSIAVAIALVMRIRAMSDQVLWEIAGLFERIGTVQDGINTIARPPAVTDRPGAAELTVPRGEIRFEGIRFPYGRDVARLGGRSEEHTTELQTPMHNSYPFLLLKTKK